MARSGQRERGTPQGSSITPPTMLQNAPIERIGASRKRVWRYAEHDVHLGLVDLHAADERANDCATGEPVGRLDALFYLSGEVFQSANQEPQVALKCLRQLTHLLVQCG